MLSDAQQDGLLLSLFATAEVMGQQLTQAAALLMIDDLREYDEAVLTGALRACRREGGRLTVAGIMKHLQAADGRPGKDEAWSIALAASDEFETVVLTAEIRQAMTASNPVLAANDKVGARMAFISAYERLVTFARAEGRPAVWDVSLGFDAGRRVTAIESAIRAQLISQDRGAKYLSDLRIAPTSAEGQAIAGLLTGEVRPQVSAHVHEKLGEVKASLAASKIRKERQRKKELQRKRVDTYLRKRQARAAIAQLRGVH